MQRIRVYRVKPLKVSLLLQIGAHVEMGQDHTSLGVHVLLGGLTMELRGQATSWFL